MGRDERPVQRDPADRVGGLDAGRLSWVELDAAEVLGADVGGD
jgi:hypothetical protein